MAASAAESCFQEVESVSPEAAYDYVTDLCNCPEPVQENEWRDFKQYFPGAREKDARDVWSELLSAFANTGGGVVIWGIAAHRNKLLEVDCITGIDLIDDPDRWAEKLRGWILDATNPPVAGVQFKVAKRDGKGFVICLIPESGNKPHRAEFATNKPYRIRVSDKCVVPNPALLRSMFFPQPRRAVDLSIEVRPDSTRFENSRVILGLTNRGQSSLREPAILVRTSRDCKFERVDAALQHNDRESGIWWTLDQTMHPGKSLQLGHFRIGGREPFSVTVTLHHLDHIPLRAHFEIDVLRTPGGVLRLLPVPLDESGEH